MSWKMARVGGLRLNNKKPANYGESLVLESLEEKAKEVSVCCIFPL